MKIHIGIGEIMEVLIGNRKVFDKASVRRVSNALKNPDNSCIVVKGTSDRSDRSTDVKNYLNWERENIGLVID